MLDYDIHKNRLLRNADGFLLPALLTNRNLSYIIYRGRQGRLGGCSDTLNKGVLLSYEQAYSILSSVIIAHYSDKTITAHAADA